MPDIKFLVGIDWGSCDHQAAIVDINGTLPGNRSFKHGGTGLSALANWILTRTGAKADTIGVAIEVPHGPVVEAMMERGFAVHSLNPKQLDRFRDRHSPAGAKDDSRDALTLADALRTDSRFFRRLAPDTPEVVQLREWTRIANELTGERTRLVNRQRQQIWRCFPQFFKVESDLTKAWVPELWTLAPTPAKARRLRLATVEKLLKRRRVRTVSAQDVLDRLREPAIAVAPGTTEAAVAHIEVIIKRLQLVNDELSNAHRQMERLTAAVAEAQENPESNPGVVPQRDVAILASLPGVGRTVLATLLTEAHEPLMRRDHHALRCLCGVAPVTRRSGKSLIVKRRLAAHKRLQHAVCHWAGKAVQRDPVCQAKYAALRARGHGHARALRSVADRLIAVACAMLTNQTEFDPGRPRNASPA